MFGLSSAKNSASSIVHAFDLNPKSDLKKLAKAFEDVCGCVETLDKRVKDLEDEIRRVKSLARQ